MRGSAFLEDYLAGYPASPPEPIGYEAVPEPGWGTPEPIPAAYAAALIAQVERQPQRRGPLLRWARRVKHPRLKPWSPWWLLGLVEIQEHPRPVRYWCVPGYPASCGLPARAPMFVPLAGRA